MVKSFINEPGRSGNVLEIGSVVAGKYKILNVIGRGGMSIVYLAMNERVNKQWAVKEIIKKDEEDFQLELQEIEMMKKLKHPHLPSIVDVIENDDTLLIVMDYIEGMSLEVVFEEQGIQPQETVIEWGRQLCDVLVYLHSQEFPIIYRDMKPGNVIRKPDGTLVLIDFGAAREYKPQNKKDTILLGTRGYAAPEQYRENGQTDERTDIYCLGVMLLQFLTGEMPYDMKSVQERDFSGLEVVLEKCIRFRKEERYQSVKDLLYALEHYWEYDKQYQKKKKREKTIFLSICFFSVFFFLVSGCFFIMEKKMRNHTYDSYLLKAKNAGSKEEEIENYKNAIRLEPEQADAYLELLDECFLDDEMLTRKESEQLRLILNDYGSKKESNFQILERNQSGYEQFAYEAGIAYFYKFEEKSNKKNAKLYFEIAANAESLKSSQRERAKRLYVISDYYYKIGLVDEAGDASVSYKDYWTDMTAVAEGNLVVMDNERTALVIYEELTAQVICRAVQFRNAGVTKKEILEQLEMIKEHLDTDFYEEEKAVEELLQHVKQAEKMVSSAFEKKRK